MGTENGWEPREEIADEASVYLDRAHLLIEDFQARWFESREVRDETIYDVQARYATMQAHLDAIAEDILQAKIRLNASLGETEEYYNSLVRDMDLLKRIVEQKNRKEKAK